MKNYLLLPAMLLTLSAAAQQPRLRVIQPRDVKKGYSLPSIPQQPLFKADTTGDTYRRLLDAYNYRNSLVPNARYSHTTSRGKVYILPYDNMPCLVPDRKQVTPMPTQPMPGYRMPNGIPESPLIPRKEEKDSK